jgi:hypothetical protein
MDRRIDVLVVRRVEGQMDREADGYADGNTNIWTDRLLDRQMEI